MGISRKASPVERLNRNFMEFQKRMMTLEASHEIEESNVESIKPIPRAPPITQSTHAPHASQSKMKMSSANPSRSSNNKSSSKFKVFQDDPEDEQELVEQDVLPSSSSANAWNEFVPESDKRKENTREASVWSGEKLPQKSALKKQSQFQVYKDEEDEQEQVFPFL